MNSYLFEHDIRKRAIREGRAEGLVQGKEEGLAQGREEGREEMLQYIIKDNISEGKTEEQIIEKLVKNYELDEDKAREYYEKYR